MNKPIRITIIYMIIASLIMCNALTVLAADSNDKSVTLKVAYYQLDGFFEYDEQGEECGYGVDYLNELCKYANINWEYIPVDSWEDIGDMMRSGEVDVRLPVSEPLKPSTDYNYTSEAIMNSYHAIMTLKSREDLYYKDYNNIKTLKIAITTGLQEKSGLMDYLTSIGITDDNLVYYDDYNTCKKALERGTVDALVSNVMDLTDTMKILDKFSQTKNYITMIKDNQYYSLVNSAVTTLELDNPSFQTQLYEEYYPDRTVEPFTREELEYISKHPTITIAIYPDRKPVSYYDSKTDSFNGIAIAVADEIANQIGFEFEYIPIDTDEPEEMLSKADLVMPIASINSEHNNFMTTSLFESQIAFAVKNNGQKVSEDAIVGVLKTTSGIRKRLEQQTEYKVQVFDNGEDALMALQNGTIDAYANSSHVMNWQLGNPRFDDISIGYYLSIMINYGICGDAEDTVLESILNKGIKRVSDNTKDKIIRDNSTFTVADLSIRDQLYMHRTLLISVLIILLAFIASFLLFYRNRAMYIRQIEQESKKTEEANRAKGLFLSRMSHEIRTPINAVMGIAELARQELKSGEAQRESLINYTNDITSSSNYLLTIVNDILDTSRIESERMDFKPQTIDADNFIKSIEVLARPMADTRHIEFNIHKELMDCKQFVSDSTRLQQIIMNLLSNAFKFTAPQGHVELTMRSYDEPDNNLKLEFKVSDNGIGMSRKFQDNLFEKFSQENDSSTSQFTGSGLGLHISRELARLMGGDLICSSEKGVGTTFIATVIAEQPQEESNENITNELQAIGEIEYDLTGVRVLMCEDHPLNQKITSKLLERSNCSVEIASDGVIGVEMYGKSPQGYYSLILMDIRMPNMDGLTATKMIRDMDRPDAADIPIVAMSANAYDSDITKSLEAGMNAHIAKPIDINLLYEVIGKYTNISPKPKEKVKPKVLLVDDLEMNRAFVKKAIAEYYNVIEADGGRNALNRLEDNKDVVAVITDIQMPDINGVELVKAIRSNSAYDSIAIIANTEYGDADQEKELIALGSDDFIFKPVSPSLLLLRLQNTLAKRRDL